MNKSHSTKAVKERALLVGISHPYDTVPVEDFLEELTLLADTAGVEVVETATQNLKHIDPSTYIGKGKVQ